MIRTHRVLLFAVAAFAICIWGLGDKSSLFREISFVSSAQAIVGRPLTPISVAGVARRTARRCAAGVYYC